MKFFFDFLPIMLFFIAFKFYPDFYSADAGLCVANMCIPGGKEGAIYAATIVAIVASSVQVAFMWIKHRRVETMHLVTLGLILVLGGATLFFQDELFIKWKPTLVNWAFGIVFFGSEWIGAKPLVRRMMESNVELTQPQIWITLNRAWSAFFVVLGVINLYVAYNYSTDVWVNFKLFGLMGITFLFVIAQAVFLTRYMVIDENSKEKES
jgi:intracellular septation protein